MVTDRVLVLVDDSRAAARAVRRAARLAAALHAGFVAVVVDTPEAERRPFDRGRDLREAADDAVDLGAELVRVTAADEVSGLEEVARSRGATHVVLPYREQAGLRRLLDRPLADRLLERLPDIELHIVGAARQT